MPTELPQSSLEELSEAEITKFRFAPFKHQVSAINFGLKKQSGKWLLLDAPGVGKSMSAMYYAETLHNRGLIKKCLIIPGIDSLRGNWKREITKFSKESVLVLGEYITRNNTVRYKSIAERVERLKKPIDEFFTVINIATIRDDRILKELLNQKAVNKFDLIIVDEAHKISASSDQGKNIMKLKAPFKLAMTGSLITNNPVSAYGPLKFIEQEKSTLSTYKNYTCEYGGFGNHQVIGYKNLDVLQDEIACCGLRRTFDMVKPDMPIKAIETELIEMSPAHEKFYEAIKDGIKEEADKIVLNSQNVLALTTRLRQATSCPSVLTSQPIMSSKVERAVELAEELIEQGEKVVIFDMFKDSVYALESALKKYKPLIATGDLPMAKVEQNIFDFQDKPEEKLLLGTIQKAGTGFSMPACHYMLMLSTPWTFSDFDQACDRIFRITSDQNVLIKVLVCQNTIDERVMEIVNTKQQLSEYLVDGKANPEFTNALKDIIRNL